MKKLRVSLVCLIVNIALSGQTIPALPNDRASVKMRIDALSVQLHFQGAAEAARYRDVRDSVTKQIHDEIDGYIVHSMDTSEPAASVALDLGKLLGGHYDTEYSGPVFASSGSAGAGASLVVGYMLERGGGAVNDSDIFIGAYRVVTGHYERVDTTGTDMRGYGLFMRQLPSPVAAEEWFLAWGPLYGYNGNRTRVRVYVFDGQKWRTVWSPEDFLDATVNATLSGFTIQHLNKEHYAAQQPPYDELDEYIPFMDQIRQVRTELLSN